MPETKITTTFKPFTPEPIKKTKVEATPLNKRRSTHTYATVIKAKDFNLAEHVYTHPVRVFGDNKIKMVKISPPAYKSAKTRVPVRVQFSNGGRVPFGVKVDKWGKMHMNLSIAGSEEAKSYNAFAEDLIKLAIKNKNKWWPKRGKTIPNDMIRANFLPPIFAAEEKKDSAGEFWDPNIRVKIPISSTTGEPVSVAVTSKQKTCVIRDEDGATVSIHDLTGREWTKAIVDIGGIYFSGKFGWGVGPYNLSKLQLAHDPDAEAAYQAIEFLPSDKEDEEEDPQPKKKKQRRHPTKPCTSDNDDDLSEEDILTQPMNFPDELR